MEQQRSEDAINDENEVSSAAETDEVETLKQALAEEHERAEHCLANWQRAQADFINYKRRTEQERIEFTRYANTDLILGLLPILDDLERALESIPQAEAKATWLEGMKLIARKLRATLETQGLTRIKALGEPFDPAFHEAMRQDKGKEGVVIEELQKGYIFHDRLLRPARVVVGNGEEEQED